MHTERSDGFFEELNNPIHTLIYNLLIEYMVKAGSAGQLNPIEMLAIVSRVAGTIIGYCECSSDDDLRALGRDKLLEIARLNMIEGANHRPDGWVPGKPGKQDG